MIQQLNSQDGTRIFINSEHIIKIFPEGTGSMVYLTEDSRVGVTEAPNWIANQINNALVR